jgi:glycine/D-amino acid oxidase-like deaminating enzyme
MASDYDVIVVGGGISGLRTADLLAKHGFSILLLGMRRQGRKALRTQYSSAIVSRGRQRPKIVWAEGPAPSLLAMGRARERSIWEGSGLLLRK